MMSDGTIQIILAIIALFGGGGLTIIANRRKIRAEVAKTEAEAEAIRTKAEAEADRIKAEAAKIISDMTTEILAEYRLRNDELESLLDDVKLEMTEIKAEMAEQDKLYRQEQALQDQAIENANAQILKLELLNIIYVSQIRSSGIEPLIEPSKIRSISIEDLRDIAQSVSNTDRRRQEAINRQEAERDE